MKEHLQKAHEGKSVTQKGIFREVRLVVIVGVSHGEGEGVVP